MGFSWNCDTAVWTATLPRNAKRSLTLKACLKVRSLAFKIRLVENIKNIYKTQHKIKKKLDNAKNLYIIKENNLKFSPKEEDEDDRKIENV